MRTECLSYPPRRRARLAGRAVAGVPRLFGAGLLALGLAPVVALAVRPDAAQAQAPSLGSGPQSRRVDFQVVGRVTYDSNVARGQNPLAVTRNVRKDDILYQPSARIDAVLPLGRQAVFLNGAAGYEFHQYNKSLQRERIDLTAGGLGVVGPCGTSVTAGFSRNQSDIADLLATVTRNTEQRETYSGQVSCGIGAGLSLNVGGNYGRTTNSAAGQGVVNSTGKGVNAGISYGNQFIGSIGLTGSYYTTDYDDKNAPPTLQSHGFDSVSGGVNYSRPIGARLIGQAALYYSETKQKGPTNDSFHGLTGSGSLSYRATPRLQATLSYQRGVNTTIQEGSSYALSQSAQLGVTYTATSRLRTSLGLRGFKRDYRGEVTTRTDRISNEKGYSIFSNASFTFGRDLTASLDASRDVRNTNLTVFDYKAYRVGLSVTKSF